MIKGEKKMQSKDIVLREIRKVKNENKKKYLYLLQRRGKIGIYSNAKGYRCYSPAEFKHYNETKKRGAPLKLKGE